MGDVQMLAPAPSKLEQYTKQLQLFDLMFLFDDMAAAQRFQNSPEGKSLLTSMEPKGITGLAYWLNGMRQFTANKPLAKPSDARGLKIPCTAILSTGCPVQCVTCCTEKDGICRDLSSLQSGVVSAQDNPWSNIYSQKYHEVQKYMMESNHGVGNYLLITNTEFWHALPQDIRSELEGIIAEVTVHVNLQAEALNAEAKQAIVDSGKSQFITLTSEQRNAWREAVRPAWADFEQGIGPDVIKAAEAANQQ